MTALTLHPHEVRAYLANRLGVIVRPLRLNIVETKDLGDEEYDGPEQFFVQDGKLRTPGQWGSHDASDKLPIPRGPFWGRETFVMTLDGRTAVYKADATDSEGKRWTSITPGDPEKEVEWRSPVTMPREYSRISGTVGDSRVCRLGEVTGAEVFAWGRYNGFLTDPKLGFPRAQGDLRDFWQATYRDYDANPWVQVARIERSE